MNLLMGVQEDFHRPQKSPGAYEWWHFDAKDETSGFSFSIQFFAGNLFSAYYQDSLKTFWEKTKSPLLQAPSNSALKAPNPLDYCGVIFRVFQKGSLLSESLQEFSGQALKASDKQGAVLLGPNRFNWDQRADPPSYTVTVQAPLKKSKKLLRARLLFIPLLAPVPSIAPNEIPSTHTWILAAPLCQVEGTLQWVDAKGESEKEQRFRGQGYHDHHFGSVPLERFEKAWHWGRAFIGEESFVYSIQIPKEEEKGTKGLLLRATSKEIQLWKGVFKRSQKRRNFFWLPYDKVLDFTDSQSLVINHHRILSDGPVSLIFEDRLQWRNDGKTVQGTGMSNYLYAPRLSNRFFFPMLKGKSVIVTQGGENLEPPPSSGDVTITRPAL